MSSNSDKKEPNNMRFVSNFENLKPIMPTAINVGMAEQKDSAIMTFFHIMPKDSLDINDSANIIAGIPISTIFVNKSLAKKIIKSLMPIIPEDERKDLLANPLEQKKRKK